MVSNQILQSVIDGIKNITKTNLWVLDPEGSLLVTTGAPDALRYENVSAFVGSAADSQEIQGFQFFKVSDSEVTEYILVVDSEGADAYVVGRMAVFQIQNLMVAYREQFDKDNFIKNLLLDNMLLVDIYNRAKKLHIRTDARRIVMILENSDERDFKALEKIKNSYDCKDVDFITAVDEKEVIIVKELPEEDSREQIEECAQTLLALFPEGKAILSYGTAVREIKDVSRSYKEARMALDVGKIFFEERKIIAYSSLGIGRLIYQLPIPLCKMFIKEIFDGRNPDEFDDETLTTINKFFENNLNVSETSRQLYIHRNTLVYRLDKLEKTTGLDLRVFEDAITFRIALMVVKYMKYMESYEY